MSVSERLEEIKNHLRNTFVKFGRSSGKTQFINDIDWLISTVEEQQKEIERLDKAFGIENDLHIKAVKISEKLDVEKRTLKGDIMNLSVEINRLREALEFYADDDNWQEKNFGSAYMPDYAKPIDSDYGEKARQALEESK